MSIGSDRPIRRLRVVPNPVAADAPPARTGGRHRKPDTDEFPLPTAAEATGRSTAS